MSEIRRQQPVEIIAAVIAVGFAIGMCLFSIRNNDIWWLMAVGRHIVETKRFITTDPFTFSVAGTPWSPQHWLAGVVFYAVHSLADIGGLIVLRAILVASAVTITLLSIRRVAVSWLVAAPLVVVGLLVLHTRFTVRAHLFEYVFLATLMYFLLTSHQRRGKSFFIIPVVLQLIWTNTHPSFFLGPALVALFFVGEKLGDYLGRFGRQLHRREWKRVGLLVGLMAAACLVNPSPVAFLTQPFSGEQRELMTRFTLEWKSPFDPALANAGFRPYFDILIAAAFLAIVLSARQLVPAAILPIIATAALSLQAHRFRAEFVLVALPMMCLLLGMSPFVMKFVDNMNRKKATRIAAMAVPAIALLVLVWSARDRIEFDPTVADRYPDRALEFVANNDIARRSFHSIGFGSYMIWRLYGERGTFIDGRNFSGDLYNDFLGCQRSKKGFVSVVAKYNIDSFILPAPDVSDFGMKNVHQGNLDSSKWNLVYMDEKAFVYVHSSSVPADWLRENAYLSYHPMKLAGQRVDLDSIDLIVADLERAKAAAPSYARLDADYKAALDVRERLRAAAGQN